ncbi:hypothetical protein ELUMI_v1c08550 [Williamsoniiplasma luminosum]|uniref:Uncharacterized protein n=1 Tax=Williamsoniiplasma luminosum TaxID=214888 RepID=A0A2K8NVK5_9MOLU|nr:hypothetical protein [Williamsoniiplasma luminosum]ATZ17576.1 hypothetical protein ELUMI_v1c08550 [Williamsoniiplasma luminosum]AVP49390.1 MAG: hypothetical protein C5T88_02210 [Williamsoniiplasma luminosum]
MEIKENKIDRYRRKRKKTLADAFMNNIFAINKSEKTKILHLLKKHNVESLLFYTDLRNLEFIIQNGINTLNNLTLPEEKYYFVWSFHQHEESIDLEFDNSSRAYFWKWTNDIQGFDPKTMAVIGINPERLAELTQKDWLFDFAQSLVNIPENIYPETFDWLLVQDLKMYQIIKKRINELKLNIDVYLGNDGIVKIERKQPEDHNTLNSTTNKTIWNQEGEQ